jgi:predicted flap endonuclease-1-like 5' DNA nuclease
MALVADSYALNQDPNGAAQLLSAWSAEEKEEAVAGAIGAYVSAGRADKVPTVVALAGALGIALPPELAELQLQAEEVGSQEGALVLPEETGEQAELPELTPPPPISPLEQLRRRFLGACVACLASWLVVWVGLMGLLAFLKRRKRRPSETQFAPLAPEPWPGPTSSPTEPAGAGETPTEMPFGEWDEGPDLEESDEPFVGSEQLEESAEEPEPFSGEEGWQAEDEADVAHQGPDTETGEFAGEATIAEEAVQDRNEPPAPPTTLGAYEKPAEEAHDKGSYPPSVAQEDAAGEAAEAGTGAANPAIEQGAERSDELAGGEDELSYPALSASEETSRYSKDLLRIEGVGPEYADLLEAAGAGSVEALARCDPNALYDELVAANERVRRVRRLPFRAEVAHWVEQAKGL